MKVFTLYTVSVPFVLLRLPWLKDYINSLYLYDTSNWLVEKFQMIEWELYLPYGCEGTTAHIFSNQKDQLKGDDKSNLLHLDGSLYQMEGKERGLHRPTFAEVSNRLKNGRSFMRG